MNIYVCFLNNNWSEVMYSQLMTGTTGGWDRRRQIMNKIRTFCILSSYHISLHLKSQGILSAVLLWDLFIICMTTPADMLENCLLQHLALQEVWTHRIWYFKTNQGGHQTLLPFAPDLKSPKTKALPTPLDVTLSCYCHWLWNLKISPDR